MDHVLSMMEKYAVTLEQQVDERTKQLAEEQKKSDILLYRILPRLVAEFCSLSTSAVLRYFTKLFVTKL
jgi:guanylate cyclase